MVPSESILVFHNLQPDLLITPDPHQAAQRPAVILPLQVIILWTSLTGNSPSGWLRSGLWDTDFISWLSLLTRDIFTLFYRLPTSFVST